MFQIQPVRSRELQEQLAQAVGAPYYPDTFAFFAAELTDDAQAITGILGLCQFTYAPDEAVIRSVAAMPGSEDDEAIIHRGGCCARRTHQALGLPPAQNGSRRTPRHRPRQVLLRRPPP